MRDSEIKILKAAEHPSTARLMLRLLSENLHLYEFAKPEFSWLGVEKYFGDYTDLIYSLFTYSVEERDHSRGNTTRIEYDYNLRPADLALNKLCKIKTPVSSNILHMIARRGDISVKVGYHSCIESNTEFGSLSFKHHRNKATAELKRRGNPPYDPSAYLKKDAWKL